MTKIRYKVTTIRIPSEHYSYLRMAMERAYAEGKIQRASISTYVSYLAQQAQEQYSSKFKKVNTEIYD